MGRMNNARARQQNADVVNKSTRSRFSSWKPPSRKKGRRDEDSRPETRVIGALTVRAAAKKEPSAIAAALEKQRRLLKGVDVVSLEAVDMSRDHAQLVEELLLSYGVVDDGSGAQEAQVAAAPPPPPKVLATGDAMPPTQPVPPPVSDDAPPPGREQAAVWTHLTKRLCFADARARQALRHAKANTLSAALDWLCVTCDEAELTTSLKRSKHSGRVTVIKGGAESGGLELAGAVDWQLATAACGLEALGFEARAAKRALGQAKGDERRALYVLADSENACAASDAVEAALAQEERDDEVEALKAIFGEDAITLSTDSVKISLDSREFLELRKPAATVKSSLECFVDAGDAYPVRGPPRLLFRNALLPPGVLRDVHINLAAHVASLDGPALYEACEWLRDAVRERHARFLNPEGAATHVLEDEEAVAARQAAAERGKDALRSEADKAAQARADRVSRVAFLKSSNSNNDLVAAKREAERARAAALKAEGVLVDEASTDEEGVKPSQLGAALDARATSLAETLGAPADACRALLKQASSSKEAKRLFRDGDEDNAWLSAMREAERLYAIRRVGSKKGLSVNNMPANFAPSPLLVDLMAHIDESVEKHPYLEANNDPKEEAPPEEEEDPAVTKKALAESKRLLEELEAKRKGDPAYKKLLAQRRALPAYQRGAGVVKAIRERRVVVVSADTGAGKTTQVPQLVLDDCIDRGVGARCSLVVTQPRRISAVGVAQRVAEEGAERIGKTVGYSIRGESKRSADTRILLCTTGVLLRRLQCDGELSTLSHVFVDEVHERDVATDFLLIILKRLLTRRPKLKLILMSATLNASVFADYFRAFDPYLAEIPGRAHPVQAFFLEDALALTGLRVDARDECAVGSFRSKRNSRSSQKSSFVGLTKRDWASKLKDYPDEVHSSLSALDPACVNYSLIVRVVEAIFTRNSDAWARHCFESVKDDEDGAILVFVTGLAEITATVEKLRMSEVLEGRSVIHALHSQLSTQDQQAIFRRAPPGSRKIVVSTNIAETSVTIDDVGNAASQRKTPSTRPPRRSCTSWTPRASRRTATTRTAASRRWKRSSCRRRPRGSGGAARAACGRAWPSTS